MQETWINENLCSFDEIVRVELGPQVIELECNDENLSDRVTFTHYRVGGRDANGKIIMPERCTGVDPNDPYGTVSEGEIMACVDWREKHLPKTWKVYQWDESLGRFIKIFEDTTKAVALSFVQNLIGEK